MFRKRSPWAGFSLAIALIAIAVLAGPTASASADCSTLVDCAVQTVQDKVQPLLDEEACVQGQITAPDPSKGDQVCQAVGAAVQDANVIKNGAVATVTGTATRDTVVCAVQGRWYASEGHARGDATCSVVATAGGSAGYKTGTFDLSPVGVFSGVAAPATSHLAYPGCESCTFTGTLNVASKSYALYAMWTGYVGRLSPFQVGAADDNPLYAFAWWDSAAPSDRRSGNAVLSLLPAVTLDPQGGSDQFVNGVIALDEVPVALTDVVGGV